MIIPKLLTVRNAHLKPMAWDKNPMMGGPIKKPKKPTEIDDSILIGFKGSLPANAIPTTVILDRTGRVAARISGVVTVASLSKLIEKVSAE